MARRAVLATGLTALLAAAAYLWRARRLPSLSPAAPPAFRRRWRAAAWVADRVLLRDLATRAGFYFALAAMWRNNTHRLTLACAAAAGCAMAVLALSKSFPEPGGDVPARVLAVQPLLYGALLVGFRHIIRVPAELRANWGFQLAWAERGDAFVNGVKGAALGALIGPALLVVLPLFVFVLGPQRAMLHAAMGLAGAIVMLEAMLHTYEKVPFACTYVPSENMKALGPIYALAFMAGVSVFARIQHTALHGGSVIAVLTMLAVLFAVLRIVAARRPRPSLVNFDEAPAVAQGLGLHL
jgi:hypothetical protein